MASEKSQRGGARGKLRAHFLDNLGRVMDSKELREVANNQSEWARRVRELRTEEGYQILTHNDRSELKPGQYLLETAKPLPAFERSISKETRAFVLDRNGFTCQMWCCRRRAASLRPESKTRLHLGHVIDKSVGGTDDPSNLKAICSVCNEGASNATMMRPDLQKLLIQVRRATSNDQLEVLKWLIKSFQIKSRKAYLVNCPQTPHFGSLRIFILVNSQLRES